jgi:cytochrome b
MNYERRQTYEPILRICHSLIALTSVGLIASAWAAQFFFEEGIFRKSFWVVHVFLGYALGLTLAVRILWGTVGPQSARWSALIHTSAWLQVFKKRKLSATWEWGHHPYASAAYLLLYLAMVLLAGTGLPLAAIEHNMGPLAPQLFDELKFEESLSTAHEFLSWFVFIFVVAHIWAIVRHEKIDGTPIAQSMISGYQYREIQNET